MREPTLKRCEHEGCDLPARYWLVWDEPVVYCNPHVAQALRVAQVMGFMTPQSTVRKLTLLEMLDTDELV